MTTVEKTTETGDARTESLPDYAPVPQSALGPALNEQGYYVGRVERNLYWVTDGTYQSAFLTTSDGVVLLDAPPTIGNNIHRAVDEIASANRLTVCAMSATATGRGCELSAARVDLSQIPGR